MSALGRDRAAIAWNAIWGAALLLAVNVRFGVACGFERCRSFVEWNWPSTLAAVAVLWFVASAIALGWRTVSAGATARAR